jgi:Uma2 family endonuclease
MGERWESDGRSRVAVARGQPVWFACYDVRVTAAPRLHYTHREYVAFERTSDVKHEFVGGLILAMAGGRPEHGAGAVRVTTALALQVRGKACTVFDSDVRIRIRSADVSAYPDASVVCGRLETDAEDSDAVINPIVIVEVLSPSTEEYDRGAKLDAYKLVPSIREIVYVAHDERRVDVVRRTSAEWTCTSYGPGESVMLGRSTRRST